MMQYAKGTFLLTFINVDYDIVIRSIYFKVKMEKDDASEISDPPLPSMNAETSLDSSLVIDTDIEGDADCKPPLKKQKCALDDLFGEIFVTKIEPAKCLKARVKQEILNFKSEPSMPLNSDPLFWWKNHECSYPLLAKLAKKYLSIPATSVASKSVFSSAGDLDTAQHSCLSGDQVNRLIFFKKNFDLNNN